MNYSGPDGKGGGLMFWGLALLPYGLMARCLDPFLLFIPVPGAG